MVAACPLIIIIGIVCKITHRYETKYKTLYKAMELVTFPHTSSMYENAKMWEHTRYPRQENVGYGEEGL